MVDSIWSTEEAIEIGEKLHSQRALLDMMNKVQSGSSNGIESIERCVAYVSEHCIDNHLVENDQSAHCPNTATNVYERNHENCSLRLGLIPTIRKY